MGVLGEGEREPSRCSIGAGEEEEEVCYDGKHWLPGGSVGAGAAVSRRGDGVSDDCERSPPGGSLATGAGVSGDCLRQPAGQCRCQEMVARRYETLQKTIRGGGTSTDRCGSQVSKERGAAGVPGLGPGRQTSRPRRPRAQAGAKGPGIRRGLARIRRTGKLASRQART